MPRPSKTWVISDTHFYHEACVEFCNRPVDFTEQTLKNMRRVIAAQDTLIHLGDVIFYRYSTLALMLARVPGKKILVMGNHDRKSVGWYMSNGFDFAADMIVRDDVIFTHRPLRDFPSGVNINVHGHLHNTGHRPTEEWYDPGGRHRLFVLEHHYKPIELNSFLEQTKTST